MNVNIFSGKHIFEDSMPYSDMVLYLQSIKIKIKKDIYNCAVKQNTARMQITCFSDRFQTNLKQIPAVFINSYLSI